MERRQLLTVTPAVFAPNSQYDLGASPSQAVAAVLIRGGPIDAVVVIPGENAVSVSLGNGHGGLGSPTPYYVGSDPVSIVVGDFNGDGVPDIATANAGDDTISVLLGNGTGGFAPKYVNGVSQRDYAVGDSPQFIVAGDFDTDVHSNISSDSYLDLATADFAGAGSSAPILSVLTNNGDGTYKAAWNASIGPQYLFYASSLAVADFNGDGIPDVAIGNPYTDDVQIADGNGDGTFTYASTVHVNAIDGSPNADFVAAGDFTTSGHADLVVAQGTGQTTELDVFLGNGDNTFGPQTAYPTDAKGPSAVAIGKLVTNGPEDILVTNADYSGTFGQYTAGGVSVLLGNGDGTFKPAIDYDTGAGPRSVVLADFNGDGNLDLLTADQTGDDLTVDLGNGNGTFAASVDYAVYDPAPADPNAGGDPQGISASGDFNGDGKSDLAVVSNGPESIVSVLLGDGDGTFQSPVNTYVGNDPRALVVGNFNGPSGGTDIATVNADGGSVSILSGFSAASGFATVTNITGVGLCTGILAADVNHDGFPDLILTRFDQHQIEVLLNNGDGTFAASVAFTDLGSEGSLAIVTSASNTYPSLAIATVYPSTLSTLQNLGTTGGTWNGFATPVQIPNYTGADYAQLATADFNGDGNTDIVTTSSDNGQPATVYLSNGDGTFQSGTTIGYLPSTNTDAITVADVNNDGSPDLVVADGTANNVAVFLNNGNKASGVWQDFAAPTTVNAGTDVSDAAVADLNGDGLPDIVAANLMSENVTVLLQSAAPTVSITGGPYNLNPDAADTLTASGSSPAGHPLSYQWDLDYDGSQFLPTATGSTATFQSGLVSGTTVVAVKVTDTYGGSALATAAVTTVGVFSPEIAPNQDIPTAGLPASFGGVAIANWRLTPAGGSTEVVSPGTEFPTPFLGLSGGVQTTVEGLNGGGAVIKSFPLEVNVVDGPALTATESTAGEVDLSWSYFVPAFYSITGYVITAAPAAGGATSTYNVIAGSNNQLQIPNLSPDVAYTFSITANEESTALPSGPYCGPSGTTTIMAVAPAATLTASPVNADESAGCTLSLQATAPAAGLSPITSFEVIWSGQYPDGSGDDIQTQTVEYSGGVTTTDPFVAPSGDGQLFATVVAVDSACEQFTMPPIEVAVVPAAVTNLTVTGTGPGEVTLNWNNSSAVATSIVVNITDPVDGLVDQQVLSATVTSCVVSGLQTDLLYTASVSPLDQLADGVEAQSDPARQQFFFPDGSSASVTGGAVFNVQGGNINPTAGQQFSGQVATFSSADPQAGLSDYTALIDWGDGATSQGAIENIGTQLFAVSGSHMYALPGSAPILISVTDTRIDSDPSIGTGSATIGDVLSVATPASATLEDDGMTVDLSALGQDAGGADQLTYSWSCSGPGGVQYRDINGDPNNNSFSAQQTYATLSAAGSFTFVVTIQNLSGQSISSTSNLIVVSQVASNIFVNVPITGILDNTTQAFSASDPANTSAQSYTATELDQFGHPMAVQPAFTWTSPNAPIGAFNGATYDPTGAVDGAAEIDAAADGMIGSATLNVIPSTVFAATATSTTVVELNIPAIPFGAIDQLEELGPDDQNFFVLISDLQPPSTGPFKLDLTLDPNHDYAFQLRTILNGVSTYAGPIGGPLLPASDTTAQAFVAVELNIFQLWVSNVDYGLLSPGEIRASIWGGFGSNASSSNTPPASPPKQPPQELNAVPVDINGALAVRVYWDNTTDNETSFELQRTSQGKQTTYINLPADATSYVDPNVSAGVQYTYQVAANNSAGSSGYCGPVTAAFPAAPTGLTAVDDSADAEVDLSWSDTNNGATGYEVQISNDNGQTFTTIGDVAAATNSFVDDSADITVANTYRVFAYNTSSASDSLTLESAYSNLASDTLSSPPVAVDDTDGGPNALGTLTPYTTPVGQVLTVNAANGVRVNDYILKGSATSLSCQIATMPPSGAGVTLNADGSFIYSPPAGFSGTDSFTYTDSYLATTPNGLVTLMSNPATVAITVGDQPVVTAPVTLNVAANDSLPVAAAAMAANLLNPDNASNLTYTFSYCSTGTLTPDTAKDGGFTYTPPAGYNGVVTLSYQVSSGYLNLQQSNVSPVTIVVGTGVYVPPRIVAQAADSGDHSYYGVQAVYDIAVSRLQYLIQMTGGFGSTVFSVAGTSFGSLSVPAQTATIDQGINQLDAANNAFDSYTVQREAVAYDMGEYLKSGHSMNSDDAALLAQIGKLPVKWGQFELTAQELKDEQADYGNLDAGVTFVLANANCYVQQAQAAHDLLQKVQTTLNYATLGEGLAIDGAELLAQKTCGEMATLLAAKVEAKVLSAAVSWATDSIVGAVVQATGIDPHYVEAGLQAVQLFALFRQARAQRAIDAARAAGIGCFAGDTVVDTTNHGLQPIDDLTDGEKVITTVSETPSHGGPPSSTFSDTQVDPATWRKVTLTMPDPSDPGNTYDMWLLEPIAWITSNNATVGNTVYLNLPELEIQGDATVNAIDPCPTIESGPGQVVLGTFEHVSNDVVDVNLVGQSSPLQVTSGHKIWSLDQGGWVAAGDLQPDERLAGEDGPVVVASVTPTTVSMPVYNLDVEGDHRYLVGDDGILVHNADPSCNTNDANFSPVMRPKMTGRAVVDNDENLVNVYGQSKSSSTTTDHARTIGREANEYAREGDVAYVVKQRSVRTALGYGNTSGAGAENLRPDIIVVMKDGTVNMYEVASDSDNEQELYARLKIAMDAVPARFRGVYDVLPATR